MAEKRRDPYWAKFAVDMPDNDKIKIIETLPECDTILWVWVRLILHAMKINDGGWVHLSPEHPFTDETLAAVYRRPVATIRLAIKTFIELEMIDMDNSHGVFVRNFAEYQNIGALEKWQQDNRRRQKEFYYRHRQQYLLPPEAKLSGSGQENTLPNVSLTFPNTQEEEEEYKNKNKNKNKEIWDKVLDELKKQVNPANFETWLVDTQLYCNGDGQYFVAARNESTAKYLEKNQHSLIERTMARVLGSEKFSLEFVALPAKKAGEA